jgi:predicted RNA-binding Zn ribbon-like protein
MHGTFAAVTSPLSVPEETKPAPGRLLLLQAFVNTWDGDRMADVLLDPAAARSWLAAAGLWHDPRAPDPAELHRARGVREAIRALIVAKDGGGAPAPGDLRPLQALADAVPLRLRPGQDGRIGLDPEAGDPLGSQLATLLLIIRDAQADGTWRRLKACRNPDCRWAFYDRSHSQRGAWCDMAVCGNRIKNRRLRQRRG